MSVNSSAGDVGVVLVTHKKNNNRESWVWMQSGNNTSTQQHEEETVQELVLAADSPLVSPLKIPRALSVGMF